MPKKPSTAKVAIGKPSSTTATGPTTRKETASGRRTARSIGKSAGRRIATATKLAGKKVGEAAARVSDLNKDGKVDREDAKIATTKAKRVTSKVADEAGTLARKLGKHDMVKDAAAGAAIGAAVALPVPVVGPAAGAAIGAIVGVAKNLRSSSKPVSEAPDKQSKTSTVKSAMRRIRKPRQSAQS